MMQAYILWWGGKFGLLFLVCMCTGVKLVLHQGSNFFCEVFFVKG